jgi:hypothetical protein
MNLDVEFGNGPYVGTVQCRMLEFCVDAPFLLVTYNLS